MERSRTSRMRRTSVVLAVAALGLSASARALAAGDDDDPARHRTGPHAAAANLAGATGVACRVGYDTETSTNVPPDDSTGDNAPAATVTFSKKCPGVVLGMFTSEISTPGAADFIHLDMRATCTGTGGYTIHCTVGTQVFASPGHTFFQNGPSSFHDGAVQMVWPGLEPGVWKFEVLPGGNNVANLQFRTFIVTAFSG